MNDATIFQIGTEGVDSAKLVQQLRDAVQEKIETGAYPDPTIAKAERHNMKLMQDQDQFMDYYMNCLREAAYVDINDFEIRERRKRFASLLVRFKKTIWGALKFYTYRLWTQQNQVNGLLVSAVDGMDRKHVRKIEELEQRLAELEKRLADKA